MKKVFTIIFAAMVIGCQGGGGFGQGGKNAAQYVKEQVPIQADNIASIETIAEDTLMSDMGFEFAEMELSKKGTELINGTIKVDDYISVMDSVSNAVTDVVFSWQFGKVANDSLKSLPKYDGIWRKVYTVRLTMKSSDTKEYRVLMDDDGITPRMMESDMIQSVEDHKRNLKELQDIVIENAK